jgi:hypothetical protein
MRSRLARRLRGAPPNVDPSRSRASGHAPDSEETLDALPSREQMLRTPIVRSEPQIAMQVQRHAIGDLAPAGCHATLGLRLPATVARHYA